MHLKSLTLQGFKTFADRTVVEFPRGITCIIGPNGSGKSNLSDALLWVLGESNVRHLRGATNSDVIFAGNSRRRPLGVAEVSLTLDNTSGRLPLGFNEITVTRRMYRSGESECFINKVGCRLRDVHELFMDTGLGRDAYAMIGQGEIDQVLSVRSEDRRAFFEEAAGVQKYRARKRESERKLETTQQNLVRVRDILGELEAQLGPLQRQAAAARRWFEIADRLALVEDAWYGLRLKRFESEHSALDRLVKELREERERLEKEQNEVQASEATARHGMRDLEARAESLREAERTAVAQASDLEGRKARAEARAGELNRRLAGAQRDLKEIAQRLTDQQARLERAVAEEARIRAELEQARATAAETEKRSTAARQAHEKRAAELDAVQRSRLAAERRRAELQTQFASRSSRVQSLEDQQARGNAALKEAEDERIRLEADALKTEQLSAGAAAQREAARLESERCSAAQRPLEQAVTAARQTLAAAESDRSRLLARIQALAELDQRAEGLAPGSRDLLQAAGRGQAPGRWTPLTDHLRVPPGLEQAVVVALGACAQALIAQDSESVLPALRWLKERKKSAVLLPTRPTRTVEVRHGTLAEALGLSAADPTPGAAWATALLAHVRVVDHLDAVRLTDPAEAESVDLWVTPHGEWMTGQGAVGAGAGGSSDTAALLARRREIEALQGGMAERDAARSAATAELQKAEDALKNGQTTLREQQARAERLRAEAHALVRDRERVQQELSRLKAREDRARGETTRIERDLAAARTALEATPRPDGEISPAAHDDAEIRKLETEVRSLDETRRAAEKRVSDSRVRAATLQERVREAEGQLRRQKDGLAYVERQQLDRRREEQTLTAERDQQQLDFSPIDEALQKAHSDAERARNELSEVAAERTALSLSLDAAATRARELGQRLREVVDRGHRAHVEWTAVSARRDQSNRQWLDAVNSRTLSGGRARSRGPGPASGSDGAQQPEEEDAPPTVARLLERWNPADAEATLAGLGDPETEIARLRRQLRSLGVVNLEAEEQYQTTRERWDFLSAQNTDLETARIQLEEVIRELDALSRDNFLTAFHRIAAAFDEMFKKLFGGGTTELVLTDPHDVLNTGIDIFVEPPGKRRQNLLLLSGGERAMTASALLFALMHVRPSPFCVLDEVDAPLDEANVGRFCDVLRDFSGKTQFIMVTHNRASMERADILYGVTMEERGVSKVLSCLLTDPVVSQVAEELAGVAG